MPYSQPYPDSLYTDTRNQSGFPEFNAPELTVETCVIGGGLAGINTALGLAQRGRDVVLLEANKIGWGASGRNGGFAASGYALGVDGIIKKTGLENAKRLHGFTNDALALIKQRIEHYKIACGPVVAGSLDASMWEKAPELQEYVAMMNSDFGENFDYWDRAKIQSHYKTQAYHGAIFDPNAIHLHPLNLTLGLAAALMKEGGQVFEDSPAVKISRQGGKAVIECNGGRIIADNLVLACSGYIESLYPKIGRATLPITTYVMVTEPLGARMGEMTDLPYSISDDRVACDYYRPMPDGSTRVLWGGRITAFPTKPANVANIMRQNMLRIYPQFADVKIDYAWSGVMGYAAHKMPLIGKLDDNIWVNTAFGGHGLVSTTAGGEVIARAIADKDKDYELFKPFGLEFTGGIFGPLAAQAIYFYNYLKDEWRIKRGK